LLHSDRRRLDDNAVGCGDGTETGSQRGDVLVVIVRLRRRQLGDLRFDAIELLANLPEGCAEAIVDALTMRRKLAVEREGECLDDAKTGVEGGIWLGLLTRR
jgi:hypothetical protein